MPRPWFQFRLGTLLLLVTLAAVAVDYWRRYVALRKLAADHEREAVTCQLEAEWIEKNMAQRPLVYLVDKSQSPIPYRMTVTGTLDRWRELTTYHREMARRYTIVSRFPWQPLAPDPPSPPKPKGEWETLKVHPR